MEGHYPEPDRLRQQRLSAAAVGLTAAAGREDEGYRRQDRRGCDKRALPAAEAEDAAPPEQPRRRLHSLVGPAGPSGPAPGPRRPARRRRSDHDRAPPRSSATIRQES